MTLHFGPRFLKRRLHQDILSIYDKTLRNQAMQVSMLIFYRQAFHSVCMQGESGGAEDVRIDITDYVRIAVLYFVRKPKFAISH